MARIAQVRSWIAVGLVWGALALPASAQVGAPVPTLAYQYNGAAVIEPANELGEGIEEAIHQFGITALASYAPGGPVIASFSQTPPFPRANPESSEEIGFVVPGAPPGSYWVLIVIGVTTSTSAPPSAWVPLVIPPRCTGRPGPPSITGSLHGSTVTLVTGGGPGCAWDRIDIEVGSSPGASNITTIAAPVGPLTVPNVPAGLYYVRARAVNAFGKSEPSIEVPITIPNGCLPRPQAPLGFTASVGPGNVVTVSWHQTDMTNIAYHQLYLVDQGQIARTFLLPPAQTSISGTLPPGAYRLGILSGGPCGVTAPLPGHVDFTVP